MTKRNGPAARRKRQTSRDARRRATKSIGRTLMRRSRFHSSLSGAVARTGYVPRPSAGSAGFSMADVLMRGRADK